MSILYQSIMFFIVGVILFLFGIFILSEKLKTLLQEKITIYLRKVTKNKFLATIFGFVITALNQSSSATTVFAVALVSSGLLSFYSSLGIIFGANIGTTITVNLVALGITKFAFILILLGFIMFFIKQTKKIGEIIFYVGLVLFGLYLMSFAIEPLKNDPRIIGLLTKTQNPLLAFFYSLIFTGIIQSSAITISSAILLGQQGLLNLQTILAIILGANIGTTVTALLASIGSSLNSKRTAVAHTLFNAVGAILFLPFVIFSYKIFDIFHLSIGITSALFHVFFNLVITILFLIFIKQFSALMIKIMPGKDDSIDFLPQNLNKIYIKKPNLALHLVKSELKREFSLSERMLKKALPLIEKFNQKRYNEIEYIETAVDNLQGEIAAFLNEIAKNNILAKEQLKKIVAYSLVVDEIERIADRTLNIAQIARHKKANKEKLSEKTSKLLVELGREIIALNQECISIFDNKKYSLTREELTRQTIKNLREVYKERLVNKKEDPASAMMFSELMVNLERMVINCSEIARHMAGKDIKYS